MLDLTPIFPHLFPFLLVLFRLTGLFIFAPVLGSAMIPIRVRVFLALALTAACYPALLPSFLERGEVPLEFTIADLLPLVGLELLVGLTVGFLATLPLLAAQLGGLMVGQQIGLGMAKFYNPAIDDEGDIAGQMLFYMALVVFVALGGIEIMFSTVLNTFINIPPGGFRIDADLIELMGGILTSAFEVAVRIASPVLCIIFLETFALGYMNRTAPAFNILSLGFPIRIILGLLVLIAALGAIDDALFDLIWDMLDIIPDYFRSRLTT